MYKVYSKLVGQMNGWESLIIPPPKPSTPSSSAETFYPISGTPFSALSSASLFGSSPRDKDEVQIPDTPLPTPNEPVESKDPKVPNEPKVPKVPKGTEGAKGTKGT
tara:strand:+ start:401 stop:718 length:318 start_codon:yes stop_codon:yes gene_type:complete